jgi:hypothetical protein
MLPYLHPRNGIRTIEWLCLVNRPLVEVDWLIAARDRAPSHDGGSMRIMLATEFVALCETGRGN